MTLITLFNSIYIFISMRADCSRSIEEKMRTQLGGKKFVHCKLHGIVFETVIGFSFADTTVFRKVSWIGLAGCLTSIKSLERSRIVIAEWL